MHLSNIQLAENRAGYKQVGMLNNVPTVLYVCSYKEKGVRKIVPKIFLWGGKLYTTFCNIV